MDACEDVRGEDVEEKGCQPDPCRTPILRHGNLFCLPLAVVSVKLRLPTSSMIKQTMRLSSSNHTNLLLQAALTVVNDVTKVCLVPNTLLFVHSR